MGPIAEVGTPEYCHFLPIRFGRWQSQLTAEGGVLRWLFGRTTASVQWRVRRVGRIGEHALGRAVSVLWASKHAVMSRRPDASKFLLATVTFFLKKTSTHQHVSNLWLTRA
jgi:hypothetical protein